MQNHLFQRFLILSAAGILLLPPVRAQAPLQVSGKILADDGTPVTGAVLSYKRTPEFEAISDGLRIRYRLKPGQLSVDNKLSVDPTGNFALGGLPDGQYVLCVEFPEGGFLDPCAWTSSPGVLLNGMPLATQEIKVQRGSDLLIRVNDPDGLLPDTDRRSAAPNLIIGIQTPSGAFNAAREVFVERTGRELALTVPFDTPLYLWVFTRHYRIHDESGKEIDMNGAMIPLTIPHGTASHRAVLTIAGPVLDVRPF